MSDKMSLKETFLQELQTLVGETCWAFNGGEGVGSIITLDFGQMIPRDRPSGNLKLDPLVRAYRSSISFMLFCPWRLESREKILSASYMSNLRGGNMLRGLEFVKNQKVKEVSCILPAYDLRIGFENDLTLVVHCGRIEEVEDDEECYTYTKPQGSFSVLYDGQLERE